MTAEAWAWGEVFPAMHGWWVFPSHARVVGAHPSSQTNPPDCAQHLSLDSLGTSSVVLMGKSCQFYKWHCDSSYK